MLTLRYTNARGNPMGISNRLCLHPDETVAKARELREEGASYQQVADAIGVPISTAWRWCNTTRKPPVAVRVVRANLNTPLSAMGARYPACVDLELTIRKAIPAPTPSQQNVVSVPLQKSLRRHRISPIARLETTKKFGLFDSTGGIDDRRLHIPLIWRSFRSATTDGCQLQNAFNLNTK